MSSSASFYIFICVASFMIIYCNALQCYQCGQYNDGVGSITPCLNYTANLAHLHLKECSRKSDKYCIKYVSEFSTVRDCVAECKENEAWEKRTFCCNENGCNSAPATMNVILSNTMSFLPISLIFILKQFQNN